MQKLPVKGGRVELTLLCKLLEDPGLDESASPSHHCNALMLAHTPGRLQAPAPLPPYAVLICLCVCLLRATASPVEIRAVHTAHVRAWLHASPIVQVQDM